MVEEIGRVVVVVVGVVMGAWCSKATLNRLDSFAAAPALFQTLHTWQL